MSSGEVKSKATLILGAGRSGYGAAKLLHKRGISCVVSDIKAPPPALLAKFQALNIPLSIGPQEESLLDYADEIVVSPGISPAIAILQAARKRRLKITSEIDLALGAYSKPWIGITGTNGKSTCTHWLKQILQDLGYSSAELGNIGLSPSEVLAEQEDFDFLVVELSSYQIESSHKITPDLSLFTSFAPDHLERHGTLKNYFEAKWRLVCQTARDGHCILTDEIWQLAQEFQMPAPACQVIVVRTSPKALTLPDAIPLLEINNSSLCYEGNKIDLATAGFTYEHEMRNAAMCMLAAKLLTKNHWSSLVSSLSSLSRLPYRFQYIGNWKGQPVINDSKSTNVESTLVALRSLNQPCYLLLGGRAKQESFSPINTFQMLLPEVLVFGESRDKIAADLPDLAVSKHQNLAAALERLEYLMMKQARAVLFSPACASFDEFENFEARGLYFKEAVFSHIDR